MNQLALAVMAGLAAYRIARIIVSEDGPWDAFALARQWFGVAKQDNWIRRGLGCVACVSFWASFVFAVPFSVSADDFLLRWLSAACVCVILMRKVG